MAGLHFGAQWEILEKKGVPPAPVSCQPGFHYKGAACYPGGWWVPPGSMGDRQVSTTPQSGHLPGPCSAAIPLLQVGSTEHNGLSLSEGCQGTSPKVQSQGEPGPHPQSSSSWTLGLLERLSPKTRAKFSLGPRKSPLPFARRMESGWSGDSDGAAAPEQGELALPCALASSTYPLPRVCTLRCPVSHHETPLGFIQVCRGHWSGLLLLLPACPTANLLLMRVDSLEGWAAVTLKYDDRGKAGGTSAKEDAHGAAMQKQSGQ